MRELHVMFRLRDETDAAQIADIVLRPTRPDADGPGILYHDETVEWHVHEHEEAPGGVIVGWDVIVVTSHESHNQALTHADIVRQSDPAADVELQPVIGNPPEEDAA